MKVLCISTSVPWWITGFLKLAGWIIILPKISKPSFQSLVFLHYSICYTGLIFLLVPFSLKRILSKYKCLQVWNSTPPLVLLLLLMVGDIEQCVILHAICSETARQLICDKKCSSPCDISECCAEQNRGWFFFFMLLKLNCTLLTAMEPRKLKKLLWVFLQIHPSLLLHKFGMY